MNEINGEILIYLPLKTAQNIIKHPSHATEYQHQAAEKDKWIIERHCYMAIYYFFKHFNHSSLYMDEGETL